MCLHNAASGLKAHLTGSLITAHVAEWRKKLRLQSLPHRLWSADLVAHTAHSGILQRRQAFSQLGWVGSQATQAR